MNEPERNGTPSELPARQARLLTALLSAPSIDGAAAAAGVGRTTAHSYLRQPAFRQALREARRLALEQAATRLHTAAGQAAAALSDLLADPDTPAGARGQAACCLLDAAFRASEQLDLTERMETLEAALAAALAPGSHGEASQ